MNGRTCVFVRPSAVRMCTVPVRGLGMDGLALFVCACECGTHVYSTRTGPGHGCVLPTGRGVPPEFILGLCATFSRVYVRYGVRLGQCEQCILYVCVCVRRSACAARALYHSPCVRVCMRVLYSIWHGSLSGVRSIHESYLHVCTMREPLEQCLAWLVRAMYLSCSCLYCACIIAQCVLCLYPLYSVLAWPARGM